MTAAAPDRLGPVILAVAILLGGCAPQRPPPPGLLFEGLPVSGGIGTARNAGFTWCIDFPNSLRCRRNGVMFGGKGPYSAAVDLRGSDGRGGFDQLILWHDRDQHAVYEVGKVLEQRGWRSCYTADRGGWGNQKIYTHPRARVRIAMDLSYWMKRRLRVIPEWNSRKPVC